MVSVEDLYKHCDNLDKAKDKITEHEDQYLAILKAVNGGSSEKKLASQLIARFFKSFPNVAEQAINALLDLCEDDDVEIRKHAIRALPSLCKDNKDYVSRIADVLTQLFQTDDPQEMHLVQTSLLSVFKLDLKDALSGLFSQIMTGEDVIRDGAIKFLHKKILTLPEDLFSKDIEDLILSESKKVLQDVTGDEFVVFMKVLSNLKICGTVQGRQQLVDIIADQLDLDQTFSPQDTDSVDRLIQCGKQALPLFSKNVHSRKFVEYIIDQVLPLLHGIVSENENEDTQLEILKLFADMSTFIGEMDNLPDRLDKVYTRLLEYMPLPPADENGESDTSDQPKLQFSYVECLMYAFHQIGRRHQEFLIHEDNAERLKDFRLRLQYFARGSTAYCKQLKTALEGKTGEALKTDENKIKVAALKITTNINALIRDLFHNPPSYKSILTLSWKPLVRPSTVAAPIAQKRTSSTESGAGGKRSFREERAIYAPPSGKFSDKAGSFPAGAGGRGRGGFRGRGRGRGFNRGVRF
ncbi:apoptosis inhibitor 5-like [Lineus longissimus]|uniref:apoptosis inhibitor 5-like n=1 Tax=Lineus longissimus TaxID=88925 RepID=UPI002B4D72BE